MNSIYRAIGTSKQNFHQRLDRQLSREMEIGQMLFLVSKIRIDHPRVSARIMYKLIKPTYFGRDLFEEICFNNGYKIERKKNYCKTTDSRGVRRFENLIVDIKLTGVNQVWVSDITYYRIGDRFYYLTLIMDLYSRRILGYRVSENMLTTNTTIPAMKMAINIRRGSDLKGLIIHSDGGGQYYCKKFLKLTKQQQMLNSMGEMAYENPNAERLNGTIKNDYLIPYNPTCVNSLKKMLKKTVKMYNTERPHKALTGLPPSTFEKKLLTK